MSRSLPQGWATDLVRVLGRRTRVVDPNFNIGRRSQIRAVRLPLSRDWGVLVTNELGDVRMYRGLPAGPIEDVPLRFISDRTPPEGHPIGWSATGTPGLYRYLTALPRDAGDTWDLLMCCQFRGTIEICRKRSEDASLLFHEMEKIADLAGVPDVIDWRRDGVHDLLLGREDGTIRHLSRARATDAVYFQAPGDRVQAGDAPIQLTGPLFPCVVDWDGTGRSDLLVGTGEGYVMLFRDIGGDDGVALARGRRLVGPAGFVKVDGPASPTLLQQGKRRCLLVAGGDGTVWSWRIKRVRSYVTRDLGAAFGGSARGIGREYRRGSWWLRPHGKGVLLAAGPEPPVTPSENPKHNPDVFDPPAPEVRLAPPAPGTYEIHVALAQPDDVPQRPVVEVRLSDEPHATILKPGEFHSLPRDEVFFKAADLTGRELCFRQVVGALTQEGGLPAYIESVRLVPTRLRKPRKRRKPVPVGGISDAVDWFFRIRMNTPEEVDEFVAKHHAAGFSLIYHKLGGGCWEYPSRIPEARSVVPDLPNMTDADKRFCARRIEVQDIIDRVGLTAEACHRRGMKCIGWMRVQNHGERIYGKGPLDRFYVEHPEYLERDIYGNPAKGKLCLAYPEVRAFHIKLIEEAMDLGCDGILMDTMRHLPKVAWGDPVCEEFRRRYGLDMRSLPPFDERVMRVQTDIFTGFLREVRAAMLDKKQDAELHVRVCRPYPLMGCDPRTWAEEGIADVILIEDRKDARAPDIAGLLATCRGTTCAASAAFCRTYWGREGLLHPYRIETEVEAYLKACRAIRRINEPSALPSRVL